MEKTKYGKYIITERKKDIKLPEYRRGSMEAPPQMATLMAYLDSEVVKGAFYTECVWFWQGSDVVGVDTHEHDYDEVVGFFGTNPADAKDLGGEIEMWLGGEKHILTKSCLIFVPKGLKHCPLIIRKVNRPIFHFAVATAGIYQ
jgi:hypothetical protein